MKQIFFIVIIGLLMAACSSDMSDKPQLAVGQIWTYQHIPDDPFEKIETYYNAEKLILEISDGYVRYLDITHGYESSRKERDFLIETTLKEYTPEVITKNSMINFMKMNRKLRYYM